MLLYKKLLLMTFGTTLVLHTFKHHVLKTYFLMSLTVSSLENQHKILFLHACCRRHSSNNASYTHPNNIKSKGMNCEAYPYIIHTHSMLICLRHGKIFWNDINNEKWIRHFKRKRISTGQAHCKEQQENSQSIS